MEDVNTAVRKAKKRASVMSALDGMYMKPVKCPAPSTNQVKRRQSDPEFKQGGKEKMTLNLTKLMSDNSDKFRNSIEEQIVGKSIVLQKNPQSESAASKIKKYVERLHSLAYLICVVDLCRVEEECRIKNSSASVSFPVTSLHIRQSAGQIYNCYRACGGHMHQQCYQHANLELKYSLGKYTVPFTADCVLTF
jgi:hypothetical protein